MATKKAIINNVTERKAKVKDNVKKIHDRLIKTSEDVFTGKITAGEKWQGFVAKTIKKSESIA